MEYTTTALVAPVFEELIHMIGSFRDDTFNTRPTDGGWTAAQVTEHIRLSTGSISQILNGTTDPTDRDPEEKVDTIRDLFMNFDKKMQSPESIIPEDRTYDRNEFMVFFRHLLEKLEEEMEELDLSQTCIDIQLPGFGTFTRVEWIAFVLYHTQRHIHQIRNISQRI